MQESGAGGAWRAEPWEGLIHEVVDGLDCDVVELRRGGTRARQIIEVRVERRDGAKVTVDDCARVSRALEARLDVLEGMPERYVLEVSSPGADRPLRHVADWRRFVGRHASVTCGALPGGRQDVEIVAVTGEDATARAVVRDSKGMEHDLALADVTKARLAFQWKKK